MYRDSQTKTVVSILVLLIVFAGCFYFEVLQKEIPDAEAAFFEKEGVYVHFIDVGQGDSALIQMPEGNLLIDAGTVDSQNDLTAYIQKLGIEVFDYVIFTHPHTDHIGGAESVLKNFKVENIILPNSVSTNYVFENMMRAIKAEDCRVLEGKAGECFAIGETTVELLAPVYDDDSNLNNTSVVAKITYGEISFLFTGDAEAESESAMLMTNEEALDSDILKLGHHGSSTSSTWDFLNAVSPKLAVASCGYENEYGHPHREIVSRLAELEVPMYRTYETGTICIFSDGENYVIQTEK